MDTFEYEDVYTDYDDLSEDEAEYQGYDLDEFSGTSRSFSVRNSAWADDDECCDDDEPDYAYETDESDYADVSSKEDQSMDGCGCLVR